MASYRISTMVSVFTMAMLFAAYAFTGWSSQRNGAITFTLVLIPVIAIGAFNTWRLWRKTPR